MLVFSKVFPNQYVSQHTFHSELPVILTHLPLPLQMLLLTTGKVFIQASSSWHIWATVTVAEETIFFSFFCLLFQQKSHFWFDIVIETC